MKLNELDERLEALRAQLGSEASSSSSLEAIPPLEERHLPEYYTQEAAKARGQPPPAPPLLRRPAAAAAEERPRKKRRAAAAAAAQRSDAPAGGESVLPLPLEAPEAAGRAACLVCSMHFSSEAQLAEHLQGKKHRQRERLQRLGPGVAVSAGAPRGGRTRAPPLPEPACQLCRKQFTSQAQLEEHRGGKWHKLRAAGELPTSRKQRALPAGRLPADGADG